MFTRTSVSASLFAIASAAMLSAAPEAHAQGVEPRQEVGAEAQPVREASLDALYHRGIDEMSQWRLTEATATFEALQRQDVNGAYAERIESRLAEIARYVEEEREAQEALENRRFGAGARGEGGDDSRAFSVLKGAGIGSLVGVGVGGIAGTLAGRVIWGGDPFWSPLADDNDILGVFFVGGTTLVGAALGLGSGAVIGGSMGYVRALRSEVTPTSRRLLVSPSRNRRGDRAVYGLGLKGSF